MEMNDKTNDLKCKLVEQPLIFPNEHTEYWLIIGNDNGNYQFPISEKRAEKIKKLLNN